MIEFEHLPKMTDEELLEYSRLEEKKNEKRFNGYCVAVVFIVLAIAAILALGIK